MLGFRVKYQLSCRLEDCFEKSPFRIEIPDSTLMSGKERTCHVKNFHEWILLSLSVCFGTLQSGGDSLFLDTVYLIFLMCI